MLPLALFRYGTNINMRCSFRKKYAVAVFALLMLICSIWMFQQEGEISNELATTTSDDALLPIQPVYPIYEALLRKEPSRIRLEQVMSQVNEGPVEVKRGNFQTKRTSSDNRMVYIDSHKHLSLNASNRQSTLLEIERHAPELQKSIIRSKKVGRILQKRSRNHTVALLPSVSAAEMKDFLKRINEYCNPPWEPHLGTEGQVKGDYKLHYVHVITRHGDRTSMIQLNIPNIQVDQSINCDLETAADELRGGILLSRFVASIMAQDEALVARPHMPRYLAQLPIGGHARNCGVAQLTPTGWLQLMRLGEHLRQAYATKLAPYDGYFRNPNTTIFKSTHNARTQQSAFAFMFGFLPRMELRHAERLQTVDNVAFCSLGEACMCPAVSHLENSMQQLYSALQKNNTEILWLLKSIAAVLTNEARSRNLPGITGQQDLYSSLTCHQKPLPCSRFGCVTHKHLAKIIAYTDDISRKVRRIPAGPHQKFARLTMHSLLTQIASQMKKISHGLQNYPKFVFYSGHDTTLIPLTDALGLADYRWPSYASNVIFELWSSDKGFFLRVLYNGHEETSSVQFCRDKLNADGLCPLHYFIKFVNKENMGLFQVQSWEEACRLDL